MCAEVLLARGGPSAYDCQAGGVLRQRVCSVDLRAHERSLFTFVLTHTHTPTQWHLQLVDITGIGCMFDRPGKAPLGMQGIESFQSLCDDYQDA